MDKVRQSGAVLSEKASSPARRKVSSQEKPHTGLPRAAHLDQAFGNQAMLRGLRPGAASSAALLSLQPFLGNQGVIRRLQAKLAVNTPGDRFEQQAGRMADAVMRAPADFQRKCGCGGTCAKCQEQSLQMKSAAPTEQAGMPVPPIVHEVLESAGQPLDSATRAFMEPRFGHDFSHVRVHTNSEAAASARSVGALAYTVGPDVVFGTGRFQPQSLAGRQLIAHELTHVVQQGVGGHVVRRAVSYPEPKPSVEDPILPILATAGTRPLALTELMVNGKVSPNGNDVKDAFKPTSVETKNLPSARAGGSGAGSGSGSGSAGSGSAATAVQCYFEDFDVKVSAKMRLPEEPSQAAHWGPIRVDADKFPNSLPADCNGKTDIPITMRGPTDAAGFYAELKANELEHVKDFKSASEKYLVPYYQSILALRGTDPNACETDLRAKLASLPASNIKDFFTQQNLDVNRHDYANAQGVPGAHEYVIKDLVPFRRCDRKEIIIGPKPKPAP